MIRCFGLSVVLAPYALVLLLSACAGMRSGGRDQIVWIPQALPDGTGRNIYARVCRPAGSGPFRVAVINHGVGYSSDRLALTPQGCDTESATWFTDRGFMVVFPLRRGYGQTGGVLSETSGSCELPDYVGAGLVGAQDIDSTVQYATSMPDARPDDAVVVGQSIGGWAVVAYDSRPHPRVSALIAFAPGRGAWANGQRGQNCRPDLLATSAAYFAHTATTPMLWVFAENDSYYPPPVATAEAQAFQAAGGRLVLAQLGPFGAEGHALFQGPGGSAVWGPIVARYLAARGAGS